MLTGGGALRFINVARKLVLVLAGGDGAATAIDGARCRSDGRAGASVGTQTCSPIREISISAPQFEHFTEGSRLDILG